MMESEIFINYNHNTINMDTYLLCVSDGSVINHDMSFGWILATPFGIWMVGSKGTCNGRGNSLRAEGAGMLSGTLFLPYYQYTLIRNSRSFLY